MMDQKNERVDIFEGHLAFGEPGKKLTIREQIIHSLKTEQMSAKDLSKALHISKKKSIHTCHPLKKASGTRKNRLK